MMHLPTSVRVYLCTSACDMRRSFDGLHALVTQSMQLDAFGGHLFVFSNRPGEAPEAISSQCIQALAYWAVFSVLFSQCRSIRNNSPTTQPHCAAWCSI